MKRTLSGIPAICLMIAVIVTIFPGYSYALYQYDTTPVTIESNITVPDPPSEEPAIALDGTGGILMAWHSRILWESGIKADWDIFATRYDINGNCLWTEKQIEIYSGPGMQIYPAILPDSTGGAIILWQNYRENEFEVCAQRIDNAGRFLWGANGIVVGSAVGPALLDYKANFKAISDNAGGAIIILQDTSPDNIESTSTVYKHHIYVQHIDQHGNLLWPSEGIYIGTALGCNYYSADFDIISDGQGESLVIWDSLATKQAVASEEYVISAQRISFSGDILWMPGGITIAIGKGFGEYIYTTDDSGATTVIWQSDNQYNQFISDIYVQRIDSTGNLTWNDTGIPIVSGIDTMHWQITDDNSGGVFIFLEKRYENPISGGYANSDIYMYHVDKWGDVTWSTDGLLICSKVYIINTFSIFTDSTDGVIIVWQDFHHLDNETYNICAQYIDASCNTKWENSRDEQGYIDITSAKGDAFFPQYYNADYQVIIDSSGDVIILWEDYIASEVKNAISKNKGFNIKAQRIYSSGKKLLSNDYTVADNLDLNTDYRLIPDTSGNIIAVLWEDDYKDIRVKNISAANDLSNTKNMTSRLLWIIGGVVIVAVIIVLTIFTRKKRGNHIRST
jgi:hypothetical protein